MKSRILSATALVAGLCISVGAQAEVRGVHLGTPDGCRTFVFGDKARPGWTISGDWTASDKLVLVDALNNRLLHYSPAGRYLGTQSKTLETAIEDKFHEKSFLPSSVSRSDDVSWLQLPIAKFAQVDRQGVVQDTVDLWKVKLTGRRQSGNLVAIYRWAAAGENEIFGYGNFRMDDGDLHTGLFRASLMPVPSGRILIDWKETARIQLWYRIGFNFVTATADGTGYAFVLDRWHRLRIARSKAGSDSVDFLDSLPEELAQAPDLPPFVTPEDFVTLMGVVETSTMPIGLFAWAEGDGGDPFLYVLWRTNDQQGSQEWFLSKIDPRSDSFLGTMRLKTAADHLMLIPGPKYWAQIEKGPVLGFGIQRTRSLTYIPAEDIANFMPNTTLCK